MIDCEYLLGLVNLKYKQKQIQKNEQKFNIEQILLSNEEYSRVYYDLKKVLIAIDRAYFNDETEKITELERQKEQLTKQKSLLRSSIETPNALTTVDECELCNDSGRLDNGEYCHCFIKNLSTEAYKFLKTKEHVLPTFSDDTISEKSELSKVYKFFHAYAVNFTTENPSILFLGQCGTGKTFLASAIASKIAKKNYNVLFFTAIEFNQILLNYHLASTLDKTVYFNILTTCDLLVIDDLGTEPIYKNVTIEYLLSIISERMALRKPIIITSNLQPDNIAIRYGERVFSRIASNNTIKQNFQGKDLRLTKK